MGKSGGGGPSRVGYQVGVFKEGKLKKMLQVKDSMHYLREKQKKWKSEKPKRSCSEAQLAALAKGRAARDSNKQKGGSSSSSSSSNRAKPVKSKDSHLWQERGVKSNNPKKRQREIRAKKEQGSKKALKRRNDSQRGISSDSDYDAPSEASGAGED